MLCFASGMLIFDASWLRKQASSTEMHKQLVVGRRRIAETLSDHANNISFTTEQDAPRGLC